MDACEVVLNVTSEIRALNPQAKLRCCVLVGQMKTAILEIRGVNNEYASF